MNSMWSRRPSERLARAAAAVDLRERAPAGMSVVGARSTDAGEGLHGAVIALAAKSGASLARLVEANLLGADGARARSVLVIGVADEPGLLAATFAPLSGMVTVEGIRAEALARAERVARHGARSMPAHVAVRHCACSGWRDPRLPGILSGHGCARVIVDERELKPRQLRVVRTLSDRLGIDLMLGNSMGVLRLVGEEPGAPRVAGALG